MPRKNPNPRARKERQRMKEKAAKKNLRPRLRPEHGALGRMERDQMVLNLLARRFLADL